ncbi:adenylate/guanylate cyclase domain-containing protein [Mesorhizobium sp.]|uniref:adenylate/guanylate cyclase domain-containing protein n=1 Tax=Mesorhizobium sp. TaxID=1871066 RepID=UPI000FE2C66C|nr:adenylate/guanylate cyclase domain-containing protein [Mesorhizobium sp.]RWA76455.1 MAG: hypothetical protein EOQ28_06405 [Mesorhizobium sp.]RWB98615.1 MAG: hypothetical protein EOQ57_21655 [Mesorhizobium sp.]RWG80209.1 MAG: hypothetical protein EOQ70_27430 [Mesorhizobium sp.]RWG87413.1 MAG: hypothetical protein EOQ69_04280 [Mesorhizobium sp.]RWJ98456.1 MAG: hypothetical protein EOR42_27140 [Mesorhizobium sp.]
MQFHDVEDRVDDFTRRPGAWSRVHTVRHKRLGQSPFGVSNVRHRGYDVAGSTSWFQEGFDNLWSRTNPGHKPLSRDGHSQVYKLETLHMRCPRCRFENGVGMRFCGNCGAPLTNVPSPLSDAATLASAERRQITVVFCDIVGSTALSEQLDPEDLRDLFATYRSTCDEVVRHCGGWIASYFGDGLLIYFGYPGAGDDDPVMAVRAAIEIISRFQQRSAEMVDCAGASLQVRIGIHTGLVVAGDLPSGSEREIYSIVGETPNLAARLQALAAPQTVLISDATYALVKHRFECRALGERHVKGISRPIRVYVPLVESAFTWQDAFEVRNLTPLVGRTRELAHLREGWERVLQGKGQVALICGDPGFGKSRLVHAFHASIADEHSMLACNCMPHSSDSAFLPIIDLLHRHLAITSSDGAAEKLAKLETSLKQSPFRVEEALPLIASLLSLPTPAGLDTTNLLPRRRRERTIEILLAWLLRETERRPVILVVEDLHWADPSTLDVIKQLLQLVPTAKLFLLLTFRKEFVQPWVDPSYAMRFTLSRLSSGDTNEIIANLTKGTELSPALLSQLIERADGVPLFVEELTKTVIESAQATESAATPALLDETAIPVTLRDSLMARLDRLNSIKATAQIAATLGREFPFELLKAVTLASETELLSALSQLVDRQILLQRGIPPQASYSFKHALIQEAAYQSLLRSSRRRYHLRAAEALVDQFPDFAERQPELIAGHLNLAGDTERAINYWQTAGERALSRYTNLEAEAHFRKALAAIMSLPSSRQRQQQEASLLIGLGTALTAIRGWAASEAEHIYARARLLCQTIGDTPQLAAALRGLQSYYQVRGPVQAAREIGEQLLEVADRGNDRSIRVEARRALGWCLFCLGEFTASRKQLEAAIGDYDPALSPRNVVAYGSDAGVAGLANLAWLEWCVGNSECAVERSREAIRLAETLAHPLSLTYALCMSAAVHQGLRQPEIAEELATSTVAIATENNLLYWMSWGTILRGWAVAEQGSTDAGINILNQGIEAYAATGAELFRGYALGLLADACGKAGKPSEGLRHINQAVVSSTAVNVHFFDAELYRIKAALLLQSGSAPKAATEALERAVETARSQGAKMLELRALNELVQLRRRAGRSV